MSSSSRLPNKYDLLYKVKPLPHIYLWSSAQTTHASHKVLAYVFAAIILEIEAILMMTEPCQSYVNKEHKRQLQANFNFSTSSETTQALLFYTKLFYHR